VFHALDEVLAPRLERLFQHDRIGHREVRRAQCLGQSADGKAQLLALVRIQPFGAIGKGSELLGIKQVALVDQREDRLFAPAWIGKASVFARQIRRRCSVTGELAEQSLPQLHAIFEQLLLGRRIGQRHGLVPVFNQPEPRGGVSQRLASTLAQRRCLKIEPEALHARRDIGPARNVIGAGYLGNRLGRRLRERAHQGAGRIGLELEHGIKNIPRR
jgi:hypothetical protein